MPCGVELAGEMSGRETGRETVAIAGIDHGVALRLAKRAVRHLAPKPAAVAGDVSIVFTDFGEIACETGKAQSGARGLADY